MKMQHIVIFAKRFSVIKKNREKYAIMIITQANIVELHIQYAI